MKKTFLILVTFLAAVLNVLGKYQDDESDLLYYGYRYCSDASGRWLSRDPIAERGGVNLYNFVQNIPTTFIDKRGLATYDISNLSPASGIWFVKIAPSVSFADGSDVGFHARYIPEDGKHGLQQCPCKKTDIILVQAIKDYLYGPHFDAFRKPIWHQGPDVPIPQYPRILDPLTIEDAPGGGESGSYDFDIEDCAVCRTHPTPASTSDVVLGCIRYKFRHIGFGKAELVDYGRATQAIVRNASTPGNLWNKALEDWRALK